MPVSEKQLAANRANAQLARGPVTAEGKKKSSLNALRHGVTAQTTVMTEEDRIEHDAFCAEMLAAHAPVGTLETFHASAIAEQAWRLNDVRAKCNNIVSIGHFDGTEDRFDAEHPEIQTAITAAVTMRDNAQQLQLLSLYEQRIHRLFEKHTQILEKLQAQRKAERSVDLEAARHQYQLAVIKGLPYDPADDGFVFSNREIARYTERHHREKLAKGANLTYRKLHSGCWELPDELPKAA